MTERSNNLEWRESLLESCETFAATIERAEATLKELNDNTTLAELLATMEINAHVIDAVFQLLVFIDSQDISVFVNTWGSGSCETRATSCYNRIATILAHRHQLILPYDEGGGVGWDYDEDLLPMWDSHRGSVLDFFAVVESSELREINGIDRMFFRLRHNRPSNNKKLDWE